uniref:RRM domain-containing protein n=1 Tax=Syphacia muris TaxID=451379 RepID=A0A0N5ADY9_9BILA
MGEFQKAPEGYEAVNEGPDAFGIVYRSCVPGKPAIWCGELPLHNYVNPVFSRKVFVGGIPWDANESDLVTAFNKFGTCRVEWPIKEMRATHLQVCGTRRPKAFGYVYIVYNDGSSIRKLLQECKQELGSAGEWYFKISTRRTHSATEVRQVQVIPWVVSDISCIPSTVGPSDPKKTVFVGGVHGMVTSQMLYSIMNEIFGSVALVELDSDKYQYPLGSGRVTFLSSSSFYRAVEDGFFEIRTSKFSKRVQVDPYIQLSKCSQCGVAVGPYFCRERICFNYYCAHCWQIRHSIKGPYNNHRPLERHSRRLLCTTSDSNNNSNNNHLIGAWNNSQSLVPLSYVGAENVGSVFNDNLGFLSRTMERNVFISADVSLLKPGFIANTYYFIFFAIA